MKRLLLFVIATFAVAAPVLVVRSAQPPIVRTTPARAIEAEIDAHLVRHPKAKAAPARVKVASATSAASATSVKPFAPRPAMRRQPKPARRPSGTP